MTLICEADYKTKLKQAYMIGQLKPGEEETEQF